jgi:two-component system OmpR family response regulator
LKTVLIVEDEPTLVATLRYNLERDGHKVISAGDGDTGLALARANKPDLVLLDLMLPGLDGLEVCRILRREATVPILMLTARADETDRVVGLEIGADDYVTKPFSMRELMARVRAMLRRSEMPASSNAEVLVSDGLEVDLRKRQIRLDNEVVAAKPKEFDLLSFLMRNRGRAFTREQLLDQVWGYDFAGDTRTVDVHVSWLRQKIERTPAKPVHLITVRGTGYRFD